MPTKVAIIIGSFLFASGIFSLIPNPLMGSSGILFTNIPLSIFYILSGTYLLFASTKGKSVSIRSLRILSVVFFMYTVLAISTVGFLPNFLFGIFSVSLFNYLFFTILGLVMVIFAGVVERKEVIH